MNPSGEFDSHDYGGKAPRWVNALVILLLGAAAVVLYRLLL